MAKKILIGLLLVSLLATLGLVGLIGKVTWDQHQDTKDWQYTTLSGDLNEVPPFLARNYIKAEDKDASESWRQVTKLLKTVEKQDGFETQQAKEAKTLLKTARTWQETYELTSGEVVTQNDRLQLYLETEAALATAYETPNTDTLTDITNRLYGMQVNRPSSLHEIYLGKLQTVANDYKQLAAFLTDTLPTLGTKSANSLTVNKYITAKRTETIRGQIQEHELTKFPFVAQLDALLGGNPWVQILNRNQITFAHDKWQEAKVRMEAFSQSMYYSPADITTYRQALDAELYVEVKEKEDHTIDENSPVDVILYQGTPVRDGQYIRKGTDVKVLLDEQYVEIPKEPEPPEEETAPEETPEAPSEEKPPMEIIPPTDEKPPTETTPPTEQQPPITPDDGWEEDWDKIE